MTTRVDVTWFAVSNCLVEMNDFGILLDGYVSRIPEDHFVDEALHSKGPLWPDREIVRSMHRRLGSPKIDAIFACHSHFDHSWDTANWALETGGIVYGSRTTAAQCRAQGVPESQIRTVTGGERIALSPALDVIVVQGNHGGSPENKPQGRIGREILEVIPDADGLRPGVWEDFPNGGGSLSFLFILRDETDITSFMHTGSCSAYDFDQEVTVGDVTYGTPEANFRTAMSQAELDRVDLWMGPTWPQAHEAVGAIIRPRFGIPQHWDNLWLAQGELGVECNRDGFEQAYARMDATVLIPEWMSSFRLIHDDDGIRCEDLGVRQLVDDTAQ